MPAPRPPRSIPRPAAASLHVGRLHSAPFAGLGRAPSTPGPSRGSRDRLSAGPSGRRARCGRTAAADRTRNERTPTPWGWRRRCCSARKSLWRISALAPPPGPGSNRNLGRRPDRNRTTIAGTGPTSQAALPAPSRPDLATGVFQIRGARPPTRDCSRKPRRAPARLSDHSGAARLVRPESRSLRPPAGPLEAHRHHQRENDAQIDERPRPLRFG